MDDRVVNALPQTVWSGARTKATTEEAPQPLFDSDISRAFFAHVNVQTEFVGLHFADGAIEIKVNEMLEFATDHRWLLSTRIDGSAGKTGLLEIEFLFLFFFDLELEVFALCGKER